MFFVVFKHICFNCKIAVPQKIFKNNFVQNTLSHRNYMKYMYV